MKKIAIFDLDGTLINTIGGISNACNTALGHFGFHQWSTEEYKQFVGMASRHLIRKAMPQDKSKDEALLDQLLELYLATYRDNITHNTYAYDGIAEMFEKLSAKGVKLAVASNKFDDGVKRLIAHFYPNIEFLAVEGRKPTMPIKPDPAIINDILERTGFSKEEAIYIGDSNVDVLTAHNANMPCIGVTYGFRGAEELKEAGVDWLVDTPEEIMNIILNA